MLRRFIKTVIQAEKIVYLKHKKARYNKISVKTNIFRQKPLPRKIRKKWFSAKKIIIHLWF